MPCVPAPLNTNAAEVPHNLRPGLVYQLVLTWYLQLDEITW